MPLHWLRAAAVMLAVLAAVSGCAREKPVATLNYDPPPSAAIVEDPPDPHLVEHPIVATVRPSVVAVRAVACHEVTGGSGFVIGPHRVITLATAVAGSAVVGVFADGKSYAARVVGFDPRGNVAILDVPKLTVPPLSLASARAQSGADALILSYPNRSGPEAIAARIRHFTIVGGSDIYHGETVNREAYEINAVMNSRSAGGPLINMNGGVLGLVLGREIQRPEVVLVLTARELSVRLEKVGNNALTVPTGRCITPPTGL
ncbi:S1-C subfamily serine protease [Mycolicibacterium sp. BK556]|uniref:trypsin-like peptidase domain-containing protein n=1 Tax=unclassified Mycolicibacterium TaxID=2636767 RepID=UPI00160F6BBD|nr:MULTISPECIES: trypsin-like peptidase domain-containing protein [unclassified Mycolicibacterium]MBB3605223.1 S1-C subfamily serine protease [Mycolicibacterium sp. BK556]MBB3635419.1 S1-C subfamily serine protease [Mycolicibacterium sp. BK607]MBB3747787.1 S1-C subfamily serine protease [Mycolicibacterium sp. BK634]